MPSSQLTQRAALVAGLLAIGACSDSSGSSTPPPDIGSAATSAQIQAARDAADGTGLALPIEGAYVTYVRPLQIGADAAGFSIQSQRLGPALFVAVDPATLDPVPVAGDQVDLTVTAMTTVSGRREASALTGYAHLAAGCAISTLLQDLSSAPDLVTGLDGYESELTRVTGDVRSAFTGGGSGFVVAGLNTAAITNDALLVLRIPTLLRDSLDLTLGCRVTVSAVPLWRTDATAQVTAWAAEDVTVLSCPGPRVLSALALSSTTVRLTFDRAIDPASVQADGSQFTFDAGLVATAAAADGVDVLVTTSAQGSGTGYTVTVAPSVEDLYGTGVDPAFDQAPFTGYVIPAGLRIDEVNVNLALGADLVELVAVSGGTVLDSVLQVGVGTPTSLATLPDLDVVAGDLIVIHFLPGAGVVTETGAKDDCTDPACYAGAWDVAGGAGLNDTTRILAVATSLGVLMDAVPFTDGRTVGVPATFLTDLQALQADGLWLPADCDGAPCTTETALAISVDWTGMGTAPTSDSVRRTSGTDTDLAADWAVGPSSFGAAN